MRLIDADALIEATDGISQDPTCPIHIAAEYYQYMTEAPTIEAEPVRYGRWISFLDGDHIMPERYYRCSECGRIERRKEPYCHCGVKMDGADT